MPNKPGPNTPGGIQRSSRNSVKHNMTSRQLIIPGEDPADLEELHRQWHALYPTDNPVAERAVGRAADAALTKWIPISLTALSSRIAVDRETDGHVHYWAFCNRATDRSSRI